jgi:hypothetical protein
LLLVIGEVIEVANISLRHEMSGMRQVVGCYLSYQSLAIIDPASGYQALYDN